MVRSVRRVGALLAIVLLVLGLASCTQVGLGSDGGARAQALAFGAFVNGGVWQGMGPVHALEKRLNHRLDVVHWYADFGDHWNSQMVAEASVGGRVPLISWEPNSEALQDIAAGRYDSELVAWADGAAAYGKLVYLRPMQEMNIPDVPWGGQPTAFIAAWRHMVSVVRDQGANNVRWVWAPNTPDNAQEPLEQYFPGNQYVDVLALDGYNWGTCMSWSHWQSFQNVFENAYERIAALGPQPIWITEFASSEVGGSKAHWVETALGTVAAAFPRIKALVYFDYDASGTCQLKIDSSPASQEAFRKALSMLGG